MALPYPTDRRWRSPGSPAKAPGTFKPAKGVAVRLPGLGRMPRVPLPNPLNANFVTYIPALESSSSGALVRLGALGASIGYVSQAWELVDWGYTQGVNSQHWSISTCPRTPGSWFETFFRTSCVTAIANTGQMVRGLGYSRSSGWTQYTNPYSSASPFPQHDAAIRVTTKAGVSYPKRPNYHYYAPPETWVEYLPETMPIAKPVIHGRPKPWRDANARPGEEPAAVPMPRNTPNPRPEAYPLPAMPEVPVFLAPTVIPRPGAEPLPVQPPDIVIGAPPNGGPPSRPGPPRNKRPAQKRHKRDQKLTVKSKWRGAQLVLGRVTEAADFVESLHKSLPKKYRARVYKHPRTGEWVRPSFKRQLAAVVKHWSHVQPREAVGHLINNQIEDTFYGAQGKAAGRFNRHGGATTGTGRALNSGRKYDPDYEGNMLPELSYDQQSGWSWDWDP